MHACECYSEEHDNKVHLEEELRVNMQNKSIMHALTTHSFVINGYVIEESVRVKYLGHIICNDLSDYDDDDMMRQRLQLYAQGNVISRRFQCLYTDVHVPVMVEV